MAISETTILGLTTLANDDPVDIATHVSTGISQAAENRFNGTTAMGGAINWNRAGTLLTLTNTDPGASSQVLVLEGDSATPANSDAAYLSLKLSDSAGNQDEFGRLTWTATDVTSGSEDGSLAISVVKAGVLTSVLTLDGVANAIAVGGLSLTTGGLGVGITAPTDSLVSVSGTAPTGAVTERGLLMSLTSSGTGNTTALNGVVFNVATANAAYTTVNVQGVVVNAFTKGASHSITNIRGVNVASQTAVATNAYAVEAGLPTGGTALNRGINVVTAAAAGTTNTGGYFGAPTGAGTTNEGIFVQSPSGAGTNKTINTDSGAGTPAHLTTSGTWTNASSYSKFKTMKGEIPDAEVDEWIGWLVTDAGAAFRYRYPTHYFKKGEKLPDGSKAKGKEQKWGGHDTNEHDSVFPLLDDMPSSLREAMTSEAGGSISTKDMDGTLWALVRGLAKRVKAIEAA